MGNRRSRWTVWRETPLLGILGDVGNFLLFAMRRFIGDRMTEAAGALTYSTLLAIVPLLVIAFAVLSGFPAFDAVKLRMEELVLGALVPEVGAGAKTYLTAFTRNASNLTTVGIIALAAAAVLLLSTVEATLNRIWYVDRPRPLGNRLLIFWAVLTVGPLLFGASFTFTSEVLATAQQWVWNASPRDSAILASDTLRVIVAIAIQSAAFTLLFKVVPAREVRLRDAAIGGVFSGAALQVLRYGFDIYLTSSTTYATIYGAVAIFPIFLLWLYCCWTVVIIGAVLAASFPDWWRRRDVLADEDLSPADRLEVTVVLLGVLNQQAQVGGAVSRERLADEVPLDARDELVEALLAKGYAVTTDAAHLSLARDLHRVTLADLARDLGLLLGRPTGTDRDPVRRRFIPNTEGVSVVLEDLCRAEGDILGKPIAEILEAQATATSMDKSLVPLRRT